MKPNILYIFSDQHRFCDVGYAGNTEIETPNLDKLAAQGAWFSSSYSSCPLCVPARGTILTGQHPLKHGAAANDLPVRPDSPSFARALNRAGYKTGYIGKWHLGGVPREKYIPEEERLGFTYWNVCNCNHQYMNAYYDDNNNVRHSISGYEPFAQTELALRFLKENHKDDKPWALWLGFGTPHDPYCELPETELEYWRNKPLHLRDNVDVENMEFTYGPKSDLKDCYAGYYGHIRLLDRQIGRLLDWLRINHEMENTIIVYTSDHGDMLGSHGFFNKQLYFEESAKVPFVVSWQGHIPAGERSQPVTLTDHMPTLLSLAGVEKPDFIDGYDQSQVLHIPDTPEQQAAYMYSYVPCHQALLRTPGSWRAVVSKGVKYVTDEEGYPVALYNLKEDCYEMNNLLQSSSSEPLRKQMKIMLDEQVERHDGYKPWQELLKENHLWEAWERSEAHFQKVWAHFVS